MLSIWKKKFKIILEKIQVQVRIRIQGNKYQFWKKKFKIILEKNNFLENKYIF